MSALALALTESYRLGQGRIAAASAGQAVIAFRTLLDPSNLDASFPNYLGAMHLVLRGQRAQSTALGAAYYTSHRIASGVEGTAEIQYADEMPLDQTATSLLYTGPVTVKQQLARGNTLAAALRVAEGMTARSVFRHTADGGRNTISNTIAADHKALGYARVTDGSPCAFCAMLASRGAVYKSEKSAGQGRRYHDGCGCTPTPIYSADDTVPGRADEFSALWADSTSGLSGKDAVNAFRRAYSG